MATTTPAPHRRHVHYHERATTKAIANASGGAADFLVTLEDVARKFDHAELAAGLLQASARVSVLILLWPSSEREAPMFRSLCTNLVVFRAGNIDQMQAEHFRALFRGMMGMTGRPVAWVCEQAAALACGSKDAAYVV